MPSTEPYPTSIADAVEYVIGHLSADDRDAIAALDRSRLLTLHHGLGTWIRNELLHPATAASTSLKGECTSLLAAETAARVAADPVLTRVSAKFEELRQPSEKLSPITETPLSGSKLSLVWLSS